MAESQVEILEEKLNWHWRNTMHPVRFFIVDARVAFFWLIQVLNLFNGVLWCITLSITALFYFMERRGLSYPSAIRLARGWLAGDLRPAWYAYRRRKLKDYV